MCNVGGGSSILGSSPMARHHRSIFGTVKWMKGLLIATTVAAVFALALAGPVRADEASFIDYMRDHGQFVLAGSEGNWISGGFQICDRIRAAGPEAGMKLVSPMPGRDPATYVYAAQHEL